MVVAVVVVVMMMSRRRRRRRRDAERRWRRQQRRWRCRLCRLWWSWTGLSRAGTGQLIGQQADSQLEIV